MSSSWWANQVGTAAAATTPAGSFPQLDLAVDLGTAPWSSPTQFTSWAQDEVANRSRSVDVARARQKSAEADQSWALKGLGALASGFKQVVGGFTEAADVIAHGENPFTEFDLSDAEQTGGQQVSAAADLPGIRQGLDALHFGGRAIATPLIMDRNTQMKNGSLSMWFDSSAWAKAWREADIRDPGSALIDAIITDEDVSHADLDRIRRTNSLYTLSSLGVGLLFGMKFDPTVLAGKALGEGLAVKAGRLPRGQTSVGARAEASRVLQGRAPYQGLNPARVYGAARGKALVRRWDDVRQAAHTLDITDYANLPMFRGKSVGGANAALATRLAAGDDKLWDLTTRAVAGDPDAWGEIRRLHESVPEELAQYATPDTRTYLDAIDAARTEHTRLEAEIEDLEKQILRRDERAPRPEQNRPDAQNTGYYRYHTWELDRDLELKKADLADLDHHLKGHRDYSDWLRNLDPDNRPSIEQVTASTVNGRGLSQRTYHASPFSKAHTISSISKAGWTLEANPYDLKRVDTGVESIRRSFTEFANRFNYYDRDALNGLVERYMRAPNELERYKIAKEVEDVHLVRGLAQKHNLSEDTVRTFLDQTRFKKNEMLDALLSGDGVVYSTAPGLNDGARLVSRKDGTATIETVDGNRKVTMQVPEEALTKHIDPEDPNLPVDPTQLPSWYVPMNIRQVDLAMKRDAELFDELDSNIRYYGRKAAGRTMESIDWMGTKFNHIWKPLQLFRLAWPQRVLMDEAFRSMAMLGFEAWAKEFAPAAMRGGYNLVRASTLGTAHLIDKLGNNPFKRPTVNIGPGPIADEAIGAKYDLAHDLETEEAPFVPPYLAPVLNNKRATQLDEMIGVNAIIRRQRLRQAALLREAGRSIDNPEAPNATDGRIFQMQEDRRRGSGREAYLDYAHPINRELDVISGGEGSGRVTYDPITGKIVKSGYAVPVVSKRLREAPDELGPVVRGARNHDLNDFIEANRDLLGSGGYRLMFDKDGGEITARVVRVFASTQEAKAVEFGKHVNAEFYQDLKRPKAQYFRDWTDQSPIFEALDRRFVQREDEPVFRPGVSPAEGVPPVYHGSASDEPLPEQLLPRREAPQLRGNLYGQGFYTSVDRHLAESYGWTGLYTIRGAKGGKTYKVFDLDQTVTPEQATDLGRFLADWLDRTLRDIPNERDQMVLADEVADVVSSAQRGTPWRSLYENTDSSPGRQHRLDVQLTRYLEERQGAGALTHEGGVFTGSKRHQVYIWLKPEELKVRPAYEKSGKFHLLEEWFENPESIERLVDDPSTGLLESQMVDVGRVTNQVPESRIVRTGQKPRAAARAEEERANALGAEFRNTEREALDEQFDELEFNTSLDSTHERFLRRLLRRKQHGSGYVTFRDADGQRHRVHQMFEGPGEVYVPLVGSSPAYARLTDGYQRTLDRLRSKAVGYKRIHPPRIDADALATRRGRRAAKEYYTAWADLLNEQVRNSPIWFKMLDGQSDEQIISWLRSSAEGSKLRHKLPHKGHNPERWVEEHRQALDFYLPTTDLQALLRQRQLRPSDLRRVQQENLPEVFGPDLEMIDGGRGWGQVMGALTERLYKMLGAVPTDVLVRQPFANGMYKLKMRNQLAALGKDQVTQQELVAMEKVAREFALRQVKRTLYDLTDDTNLTQALRFVSPFFGAQMEALEKWARIVAEKPETVARFYVGQDAAYSYFGVIDEDGKKVTSPDGPFHYNPNHRIVVQIPKAARKLPFFQKALKQLGSVDFNIGMLNTALQGDQPLLPSLGPVVVLPADWYLDNFRKDMGGTLEKNDIYNWLFPVGRPDGSSLEGAVDQMFPSWVRRLSQMSEGQKNRTYANAYVMMQRELEIDHRRRGLPSPSPEQIKAATDNLFMLRSVASFGLPVAMNFRPKHQFFLDEYHKMQQQYGPGAALEKFVEKYGVSMAHYAASSSESDIPPTAQGLREWAQKDKLIAAHPEWASAMISPDAWADEFSSAAYSTQFEIPVSPGSTETLRTMRPNRLADVDRTTGWIEYRKFNSALQAELYNRGLNSLTQTGAEDLAQMKSDFVADLMGRNKPWAEDYRTFEDTIDLRVASLKEWVYDRRFDNRPDIQGVRQYLALRDAAAESLDQYHVATGGSRSLQAQENSNLRNWFYGQVGALIMANPAFGEFYTRYLESDRLTRGSGV